MAVILVHQGTGLTRETYEKAVRKLTGGDSGLRLPADWPVAGLLVHAAGEGEGGFRVVDVWESSEAAQGFGAKIGPILQELGIDAAPELYEAHTFVSA